MNIVERSVQTIDNKISPTIATAKAGCLLGDAIWYSALQNVILSHNCQIHASRVVTRFEDFYGHAPNMDALFRYRLGQYVTVSEAPTKRSHTNLTMRGIVCVALHGAREQGTWVWCPNKRTAYLRGHLYLTPVEYAGIPNQSMMVEEDTTLQAKGDAIYPHPSIVKFIERHVELENVKADVIDTGVKLAPNSSVPSIIAMDHICEKEIILPTTVDPIPAMDIVLENDSVPDPIIGTRVRRQFRKKGKWYSGTVIRFMDPYYWAL